MKIQRKYLIGSAIGLIFTLFALVRLPASLLLGYLPAQVRIDGCEGTIWSGRATAVGFGGQVIQQNVNWEFLPGSLFSGRVGWEIRGQYRDDASKLRILITPKHLEVQNLELAMPLEPMLTQDQKLKALRFGGLLRISAPQFVTSKPFTINAKLENFFSALTASAGPLGSYQMTLNMLPDRSGDWQISHLDGVLNVNGRGRIEKKDGVSGRVLLRPDENAASYLQTMLAMLPRDEDAFVLNLPMR